MTSLRQLPHVYDETAVRPQYNTAPRRECGDGRNRPRLPPPGPAPGDAGGCADGAAGPRSSSTSAEGMSGAVNTTNPAERCGLSNNCTSRPSDNTIWWANSRD